MIRQQSSPRRHRDCCTLLSYMVCTWGTTRSLRCTCHSFVSLGSTARSFHTPGMMTLRNLGHMCKCTWRRPWRCRRDHCSMLRVCMLCISDIRRTPQHTDRSWHHRRATDKYRNVRWDPTCYRSCSHMKTSRAYRSHHCSRSAKLACHGHYTQLGRCTCSCCRSLDHMRPVPSGPSYDHSKLRHKLDTTFAC